jgi:hypothetical protein
LRRSSHRHNFPPACDPWSSASWPSSCPGAPSRAGPWTGPFPRLSGSAGKDSTSGSTAESTSPSPRARPSAPWPRDVCTSPAPCPATVSWSSSTTLARSARSTRTCPTYTSQPGRSSMDAPSSLCRAPRVGSPGHTSTSRSSGEVGPRIPFPSSDHSPGRLTDPRPGHESRAPFAPVKNLDFSPGHPYLGVPP